MARTTNPLVIVGTLLAIDIPIPFIIATRPSFITRLSVFLAQLAVVYYGVYNVQTQGPFQDYSFGGLYGTFLFTAFHFYFITDALSDGTRHVHDTKPVQDMGFLQRIWWSWCLRMSVRGIGWTTEAPHLPPAPKRSRWPFVLHMFLATIRSLLILDLAGIYFESNPIFSSHAYEAKSFASQGFVFQALSGLAFWAITFGKLALASSLSSLVVIALGLGEPSFWRPPFGSFTDAYTVRRLWGRVWHQILRRYVASIGKFVTKDVLNLRPGTKLSAYTQVWVGFLVSGTVHVLGDPMMDNVKVARSLVFFLSQPLAIMLEDEIIAFAKCTGVPNHVAWRILGHIWTALWFIYTTPLLSDIVTDVGRPWVSELPFSPIRAIAAAFGLTGKIAFPWPT